MIFSLPQHVQTAIRLLKDAGFHGFPVGGCVRDTLMGRTPHDWDMCTDALPEEMHRAFEGYRTVDTGIRHGTVTLILDGEPLQITTFRQDGAYRDTRHPESVTFTRKLEVDLSRRDFTVNAMAYDPESCSVVDLFHGQEDIAAGVIRCVGDPDTRFREDALRILRAVRFSGKLGFHIEENTFIAMEKNKALLDNISRERVASELNGLLLSPAPEGVLDTCRNIIFQVLPRLSPMASCPQTNPYHCMDVWQHSLKTVSCTESILSLRWAALLHDSGKPATRVVDGERDHFPGHQHASRQLAVQIMEGLKQPRALTDRVALLIEYHDERPEVANVWPLLAKLGEDLFFELLKLKQADLLAHAPWVHSKVALLAPMKEEAKLILAQKRPLSVKELPISGREIEALGAKGRDIGRVLSSLFDRVIKGELACTGEALLAAAGEEINSSSSAQTAP